MVAVISRNCLKDLAPDMACNVFDCLTLSDLEECAKASKQVRHLIFYFANEYVPRSIQRFVWSSIPAITATPNLSRILSPVALANLERFASQITTQNHQNLSSLKAYVLNLKKDLCENYMGATVLVSPARWDENLFRFAFEWRNLSDSNFVQAAEARPICCPFLMQDIFDINIGNSLIWQATLGNLDQPPKNYCAEQAVIALITGQDPTTYKVNRALFAAGLIDDRKHRDRLVKLIVESYGPQVKGPLVIPPKSSDRCVIC